MFGLIAGSVASIAMVIYVNMNSTPAKTKHSEKNVRHRNKNHKDEDEKASKILSVSK